ncbi:cytochrome P450 [Marinactinospora thermotolerans]|uniref:cytochrome P450 n=1 Tax=Marinactinospora thermotolerans TaxID=531310 RepID=UPI003D901539
MSDTGPKACPYPFGEADRLRLDPRYAEARSRQPLLRIRMPYGDEGWLVTRYEDVRTVLADPRFSRALAARSDEPRTRPVGSDDSGILGMDPPDHTRLRRLVSRAFTVRRVERLRPRMAEIAEGLAEEMLEQGPPVDLVEAFALPLPVTVICELLGVPYADRERFRRWSEAFLSTTALSAEEIDRSFAEIYDYMHGLVELRRTHPADDLITGLVEAGDAQDRLGEEEMVKLAIGLLVAGHETTASQIPNFVYTLLTRPGAWERLADDPGLVPSAVEELMRHIPLGASSAFPRYALEDVELSGGVVRAGQPVVVSLAAANRDPEIFDDPEELVLERASNPHIGFGHGPHHCLGAQLARAELQVGLRTLLDRFPDLRFAVPEPELSWKSGMLVRGLKAMPVTW